MCLTQAPAAFPSTAMSTFRGEVSGYACGGDDASMRIVVLPDIYGCSPFYRSLAARYAAKGARVFLVDPFIEVGELPEATREAAFARRHSLRDKALVDALERWFSVERITGVLGFCLGGLYVFELARRGATPALAGLYGFPQGMPNDDPLPVPFDHLRDIRTPFTMLMGAEDAPVGPAVVARLAAMAPEVPAMALTVYPDVGHNFLADVDSDDAGKRGIAEDALRRMDSAMLAPSRVAPARTM